MKLTTQVCYSDSSKISKELFSKILNTLPLSRRKQINNLTQYQDKLNSALSFCLLREMLKRNKINVKDDDFIFKNKPSIKNNPCYFNISHSGNIVMVGISNHPIGVDIQEIKNNNTVGLRNRIFNSKEKEDYQKSKNKNLFFHNIWTKKESYAKCLGKGLSLSFAKIDLTKIKNYNLQTGKIKNYSYSICHCNKNIKIKKIKTSF